MSHCVPCLTVRYSPLLQTSIHGAMPIGEEISGAMPPGEEISGEIEWLTDCDVQAAIQRWKDRK